MDAISFTGFLNIHEIKTDDQFIHEQIQIIDRQRIKFIKFCDDSLSLSDTLVSHANDLLAIRSVIEENNFDNGDLVEFFESLLSDARKDKSQSEEFEKRAEQIKDDLVEIYNELVRYSEKVSGDIKNIQSNTNGELNSTEEKMNTLKKNRNRAAFRAGGAAILAASATAFLGRRAASLAGGDLHRALEAEREVKRTNNIIRELDAKLNEERDRLLLVTKMVETELENVFMNMSSICTYWGMQVNYLEAIIHKLEKLKNSSNKFNKFTMKSISESANQMKNLAHEYCQIMNLVLSQV